MSSRVCHTSGLSFPLSLYLSLTLSLPLSLLHSFPFPLPLFSLPPSTPSTLSSTPSLYLSDFHIYKKMVLLRQTRVDKENNHSLLPITLSSPLYLLSIDKDKTDKLAYTKKTTTLICLYLLFNPLHPSI